MTLRVFALPRFERIIVPSRCVLSPVDRMMPSHAAQSSLPHTGGAIHQLPPMDSTPGMGFKGIRRHSADMSKRKSQAEEKGTASPPKEVCAVVMSNVY